MMIVVQQFKRLADTWMIVGSKPSNFELQLGWLELVERVQLRNFTPNPVPDTYDQLGKTPSFFFLHVCVRLCESVLSQHAFHTCSCFRSADLLPRPPTEATAAAPADVSANQ
jgi:hypothetical protein